MLVATAVTSITTVGLPGSWDERMKKKKGGGKRGGFPPLSQH